MPPLSGSLFSQFLNAVVVLMKNELEGLHESNVREQTYLYFLLLDEQHDIIFCYSEEDKKVRLMEEGQQSFQPTYLPINQELDAEVNGEKEDIYDVGVQILLDDEYLGMLRLGYPKDWFRNRSAELPN